jgi:hypothetical protein
MTFKRATKKVKLPAAQPRRKQDVLVFMDPTCVELDEHTKAQNIACKHAAQADMWIGTGGY